MSSVTPASSSNGATHRPSMPSKPKPFTDDQKAAAVERVKEGEATWTVALDLRAHDAQIRDWCRRADFAPPPPVHDEAFIKAAVARVNSGESVTSVILSLGIGRETLQHWVAGKVTMKAKREAVAMLVNDRQLKRVPKAKPGKRRIFDDAYKAEAVAQLKGDATTAAVARKLNIIPGVLQRWVRESNASPLPRSEKALIKKTVATVMGKPAFTQTASGRRQFTPEAKAAAVQRWEAGESHSALMKELKIASGQLSAWRKELAARGIKPKRKYEKRTLVPGPAGALPMASALALRDAITYLKHVKTDMYALLGTGVIKEFEEYHLNVLAALKRLQSVA